MFLINILDILINVLYAANITLYILQWNKCSMPIRILSIYLAVAGLIAFSASILASLSINNIFLLNILNLVQLILLSGFLIIQIENTNRLKTKKKIIAKPVTILVTCSCLLLVLTNIIQTAIQPQYFFKINDMFFLLTRMHILVFTLIVVFKTLTEKTILSTINIALFIYMSGTTLCFLTISEWQKLQKFTVFIWSLNAFFNIGFLSVLFIVGLNFFRNKNVLK